jgi:peptide/nickel transport system substrate-binding protein
MTKGKYALAGALLLGVSMLTSQSFAQVKTAVLPDPPKFDAQQAPNFVSISDIMEYKALPEYHEPQWVTDEFVKTGKLPAVKDRLPKEPLVYKTGNEPAARKAGTTPPARSRAGAASTSACTSV